MQKVNRQAVADALETNDESCIQGALAGLFVWGIDAGWQPQRRDAPSFQYLTPHTDTSATNYYSEGKLHINVCNKIRLKQKVCIDVGRCPPLRQLLDKVAADPPCAHILFCRRPDGSCEPMAPSTFNYRLHSLYKAHKLPKALCVAGSSVTVARHAATEAARKRPALTPAEREAEKRAATERLHSVRTADTRYAQPPE